MVQIMARRNDGVLDLLADLPWWVSVFLSAAIYVFMKFIAPTIQTDNIMLRPILGAMPMVAALFAFIVLAMAPIAYFKSRHRRKLVETRVSLESIKEMDWRDFEMLVGEVYRRQGYLIKESGGGGADGGIDLVLTKAGERIIVQCKKWKSSTVNVSLVRELYGVMTAESATGCIFVSAGSYTRDANEFARGKPIRLVDGIELYEMVKSINRNDFRIRESQSVSTKCPICGSDMVLRTAKKSNAGQKFMGCSRYPKCRGTRDV